MTNQPQLPPEVEIQSLKDTIQVLIRQRDGSISGTLNENAQLAVQVQTLLRNAQESEAKIKALEVKLAELVAKLQANEPTAKPNGAANGNHVGDDGSAANA